MSDYTNDPSPVNLDGPAVHTWDDLDEIAIPMDAELAQALFDVTEDDRATYREWLQESPPDDWHDLAGPGPDEAPSGPVDAIQSIVEALDEADTEFGAFLAAHLRELVQEGTCLGFPKSIDEWFDRRAASMGYHHPA